uniref:Very-long-chain (3R)-3-hydroxyacyl-CoA dehydratase n=1 Tax=Amphilophus citrinellus TaxID=61819 RepID=A0A3Q0SIE4_AMPCI
MNEPKTLSSLGEYFQMFCGHTWILANTIARFLMFGQDALADTFYSVGFVMSLCQLLSILELFHIADGIEKARLLPRFIQARFDCLSIFQELQSKPVVCAQFFFWNILDLLRSSCLTNVIIMSLSGVTIYQALPYVEQTASHCAPLNSTIAPNIHLPFVLVLYLPVLTLGKMGYGDRIQHCVDETGKDFNITQ